MIKESNRTFYDIPRFPDFPFDEWKARVDKAQKLMSECGIECLVLWEKENIRYFFGFMTIHWYIKSLQPAVGIIPVNGEPILIVPNLFKGNAEGLCWIKNIWIQLDPIKGKSHRDFPKEVAGVIKEIGCENKNIALEMGPLGCMWIPRPLNDIEAFKNALPKAKFIAGDGIIWGCRMIKSPLEIERIERSIRGITAVELAIVEEYRPGMMEEDLMKIINFARVEQGGNCLGDDAIGAEHLICSSEKYPFADIKALEGAKINKGDAIQFVSSFYYKGYTPDSTRRWYVSPIAKEIKSLFEIVWEAQDDAQAVLRPGVKAKEVYGAMFNSITKGRVTLPIGVEVSTHRGHGTGLDLHEPPIIDALNDMVIQKGMTLSIEPWLNQEKGSYFGIGDTFVVTENGCEKIEGLSRDIIQVSHVW